MYILDTDHIGIGQQRSEPECGRLLRRMSAHPRDAFYVAILSFQEQVDGWNVYLKRAKTLEGLIYAYSNFERILSDFTLMEVLPFDRNAADAFQSLREQRIRVGTMDLRIAAVALSRDMTLLSRNLKDFRKVPGLKVEDWTAAGPMDTGT